MSNFTANNLKTLIESILKCSPDKAHRKLVCTVSVRHTGEENYSLGYGTAEGAMNVRVGNMWFTLSGFKDCCGIMVMSALGGGGYRCLSSVANIKLIKYILNQLADYVSVGAILYTTTPHQDQVIKVIRECGFRKGSTFSNPRTSNNITMWTKKVNQ